MRKTLTSFLSLLFATGMLFAQDPVTVVVNDSLIISEVKMNTAYGEGWGYIELANMGSTDIDLSEWWLQATWWNGDHRPIPLTPPNIDKYNPSGIVKPGETFIVGVPGGSNQLDPYGKLVYPTGFYNKYAYTFFDDYLPLRDDNAEGERLINHDRIALMYRGDIDGDGLKDSVMIDKFWYEPTEVDDFQVDVHMNQYPIAGLISDNPRVDHAWMRKYQFKHGNTNFIESSGTNLTDSEWMPIPKNDDEFAHPYTTMGVHMGQENLSISSNTIDIDLVNKKLKVPYGIRRDSVFGEFDLGLNHSFEIQWGLDTTQVFVQTNDTLIFYVYGTTGMKVHRFACTVDAPSDDWNGVRPLNTKNANGVYSERYTVSRGLNPDTIGNVPFSLRMDTLMDYLALDNGATYSFIWVDGVARPDLKYGDKLVVTSKSGKQKEYKICVNDYFPDHNAALSTIIFPGLELFENPETYVYTDTLLSFKSNAYFYQVMLPEGTEISPAIFAVPQNNRANVTIKRAKNLTGTEADRTAIINVAAEDDTTLLEYKIMFTVQRETPPLQGTPFFCDFGKNWGFGASANTQIFNPSDESVNLGDYMICQLRNLDYLDWWNTVLVNDTNKWTLRPGYKVMKDVEGNPYFEIDGYQNSFELGSKEVYSIANPAAYPMTFEGAAAQAILVPKVDYVALNSWKNLSNETMTRGGLVHVGDVYGTDKTLYYGHDVAGSKSGHMYAILKITNDSVRNGSKRMNDMNDYEMVDVVNGPDYLGVPWNVRGSILLADTVYADSTIDGTVDNNMNFYRLPSVYKGNPIPHASFGDEGRMGEWVMYGLGKDGLWSDKNSTRNMAKERFENHTMITAVNIPYISSPTYLISKGISDNETIYGVAANTSVDAFVSNIVKPDVAMQLKFTSSQGVELVGNDNILEGATLITTSADGLTSITYKLHVGSLDANVLLSSTTYAVTADVATAKGKITGIPFGSTIKEVLENIVKPDLATLAITDGGDMIIPTTRYSNDTNMIIAKVRVDVLASEGVYFEVVAQNGVSKCLYSLEFAPESVPFAISDVYDVDQDGKYINYVGMTTVAKFLSNVVASPGATLKVLNKMGQERELGWMSYDHRLLVTSADGTKTVLYWVKFTAQKIVDGVEKLNSNGMIAYPNPTSGAFLLSGLKDAERIEIRSLTGNLVGVRSVSDESMQINELQSMPCGIYFITIVDRNESSYTIKMVKK